mmetsp:Transcript_28901/g.92337  ORF Transcript_28901/g.92337 Transcript_28901/m.92337 type:complete len:201 (-) Transcript_28901:805-1407(-)
MLGAHQRKAAVNLLFVVHWVLTFCFLISAFVVAGTANAGFNVVLTGLMYVAFGVASFLAINRYQSSTLLGSLIGVSGTLTLLSLQTAIFWGQLSNCSRPPRGTIVEHYTCENTSAMQSVCAFAALLFLLQLVITLALFSWRDELAHGMLMYSQVNAGGYGDASMPPPESGPDYAPYGGSSGYGGGGGGGSYQGGVPQQDV